MDRFPLSHAKVLTDLVINILKSGYFLEKKISYYFSWEKIIFSQKRFVHLGKEKLLVV